MTLPFSVPDWLPWWVVVAVLVPALLWLLAMLAMPFNVFGVKARLDLIEARLDEIQGEIRTLVLRLPEAGGVDFAGDEPVRRRPPVAPPAPMPAREPPRRLRPAPVDERDEDYPRDEYPRGEYREERPPARPPLREEPRDLPRPGLRPDPRPSREEPRLNWPRH